MRLGGAEGPQNGTFVSNYQTDGGQNFEEKSFKREKPNHQANVNLNLLMVPHKPVSSTNANKSVRQQQQPQQHQVRKNQKNRLLNPAGNNKHNNNSNKSRRNNNHKTIIDEICYKSPKRENPKLTSTSTSTTTTTTKAKEKTLIRPKATKTTTTTTTTTIKERKTGGLDMSLIVKGFATLIGEIMRVLHVQESLGLVARTASSGSSVAMNKQRSTASVVGCLITLGLLLLLLPCGVVHGDDDDHFFGVNRFSMGLETTTPEFDYASRGQKKFGDKCENTLECGFPGSICDPKKKSCQCTEDLSVTNHYDKCGKEAAVNESCFFNEQCEAKLFQTECRDSKCVCRFDMAPVWGKDGTVECKGRQEKRGPDTYIDPAMIGVLVGMALMFVIICVVLRLFSQARWRENRTIFNTPNPRLMNVSLLRDSKLIHGQERRGSRMSMRGPSRQPSMASLRPHSPNPSLGKTGRMTRSKSNTRSSDSRVSDVSNCSRLLEHHSTHGGNTIASAAAHTPSSHMHSAAITTTYVPPSGPNTACSISLNAQPPAATITSPNASSRSNSHGSASNASATSVRSTRSNSVAPTNIGSGHHERHGSAYYQHQHTNPDEHVTHITTNPVAESVTVEIMTPYK